MFVFCLFQCAVDLTNKCSSSKYTNDETVYRFVEEINNMVGQFQCYRSKTDSLRMIYDGGDIMMAVCHCTWPILAFILCWISFGISSWCTHWWQRPDHEYCHHCGQLIRVDSRTSS